MDGPYGIERHVPRLQAGHMTAAANCHITQKKPLHQRGRPYMETNTEVKGSKGLSALGGSVCEGKALATRIFPMKLLASFSPAKA